MRLDFHAETLKLLSSINRVVNKGSMEKKTPFQIYRRATTKKVGGKPVYKYYVKFLDEETGEYNSGISSGQTAKQAAFTWAMANMSNVKDQKDLTWAQFTLGIFDPQSEFFSHHEKRGKFIGEVHRKHHEVYLRKYILPFWDKLKISKTSSEKIEDFQSWLIQRPIGRVVSSKDNLNLEKLATDPQKLLSAGSAQKIMNTLRLLVKWALKKKHLEIDPFVGVDPLIAKRKRRGILTLEEVRKLFDPKESAWPDDRLRVLSLVAVTSGLRAGELRGLLRESVKEIRDPSNLTAGLLVVEKSWSQIGELKLPKSGKSRTAVVPHAVYAELRRLLDASPYRAPTDFVFYQAKRNLPVSHQMIYEHFVKALAAIGINDEQRTSRNLVFHGFRHFANTYFVGAGVPVLKLQAMLGHNSESMTMNYLHVGQDFADVLNASGKIFEDFTS